MLTSPEDAYFAEKQNLKVYSGPGKEYLVGADGNASLGTGDWVECFGSRDDYYLVEYGISTTARRRGYICASDISGSYHLEDLPIPNANVTAVFNDACDITDDPDWSQRTLYSVNAGTQATIQFFYMNWVCVEVRTADSLVQGYVPADVLSLLPE